MPRRIRFGLQVTPDHGAGLNGVAVAATAAEGVGFDVVSVADHIGNPLPPPIPLMAQMAVSTNRIGVGSLVLNNDMRNPVQLAWEIAWLQETSGGRFELGLGAGHIPHEYEATGIRFDQPARRKARLAETVEILAGLFRGDKVDHAGQHYQLRAATISPPSIPVPLLVGGNVSALLTHAARHADIIGLQGLGRTKSNGQRHKAKFKIEHLEAQLSTIASTVDHGVDGVRPELNALVQAAEITDDRAQAIADIMERIEGLTTEQASSTPYLALGTVDELAAHFVNLRDRWGISYFTVRNPDWGPVIERVRELDDVG